MKDKIEEAKIRDVEVGFNICAENGQLHDESHCVGTECEIEMPETCLKGTKVGIFHTHAESLEPSITDIFHSYAFGINCIGSIEKKKIRCHIRKDKIPNPKDMKVIESNILRFEEPLLTFKGTEKDIENYRRWIRVRNDLKKDYLNTIDIV